MEVIKENFADALRTQKPGETLVFPLEKYATIRVTIHRMKIEMWEESPVWDNLRIDKTRGILTVKRLK